MINKSKTIQNRKQSSKNKLLIVLTVFCFMFVVTVTGSKLQAQTSKKPEATVQCLCSYYGDMDQVDDIATIKTRSLLLTSIPLTSYGLERLTTVETTGTVNRIKLTLGRMAAARMVLQKDVNRLTTECKAVAEGHPDYLGCALKLKIVDIE